MQRGNNMVYKKISLICVLLLILTLSLMLPVSAFADYETDILSNPQAVVNFNQQLDIRSLNNTIYGVTVTTIGSGIKFSGTSNDEGYITLYSMSTISGHIYYFYSNMPDDMYDSITLYHHNGTSYDFQINASSQIITFNGDYSTLDCNIHLGYTFNGIYYFNLIDLTQMFGSNSIPSLEDCKKVFIADYYTYDTGTPMSYNTLDAYNNGVQAYLGSQEYKVSSAGFVASVNTVVLNDDYGSIQDNLTKNVTEGYITYIGSQSGYDVPTLVLPFNYTLPGGTQITIKCSCSTSQYHASYYIYFGFWGNGVMVDIPQGARCGTQLQNFRDSTITYTTPMAIDRIYIMLPDDATVYIKNVEVGYYITNVDALREEGYKDGMEYVYDLYKPTGSLYQSIYQKGWNDGHDAPEYDFKYLITAAVDTPLQAFTQLFDFDILGVNMKTFYLSVFTLAVIITIIKMVL